jgi:hypothetical protein
MKIVKWVVATVSIGFGAISIDWQNFNMEQVLSMETLIAALGVGAVALLSGLQSWWAKGGALFIFKMAMDKVLSLTLSNKPEERAQVEQYATALMTLKPVQDIFKRIDMITIEQIEILKNDLLDIQAKLDVHYNSESPIYSQDTVTKYEQRAQSIEAQINEHI